MITQLMQIAPNMARVISKVHTVRCETVCRCSVLYQEYLKQLRGKGQFMNDMRLSTVFMNGVKSRFVPNVCSDQGNKVTRASPAHKN